MEQNKTVFINEKYKIATNIDKKYKEVVFSYDYKNQTLRRFVIIKTKPNVKDSYYLDIAKKQIENEKKNGKLLKYSKKYAHALNMTRGKRIARNSICAAAIVGAVTAATVLSLHYLTWRKISNEEASKIVENIKNLQGGKYEDPASIFDEKPTLFNLIRNAGGQFSTTLSMPKSFITGQDTDDMMTLPVDCSLKDDFYVAADFKDFKEIGGVDIPDFVRLIYQKEYGISLYRTNNGETAGVNYIPVLDYDVAMEQAEKLSYNYDIYRNEGNLSASLMGMSMPTPSRCFGRVSPMWIMNVGPNSNAYPNPKLYLLSPFFASYVLSNNSIDDAELLYEGLFEEMGVIVDVTFTNLSFAKIGDNDNSLRFTVDIEQKMGSTSNTARIEAEFINGICTLNKFNYSDDKTGSEIILKEETTFKAINEVDYSAWVPEERPVSLK